MIPRQRGEYHYQLLLTGPRSGELSRLVKRHLGGLRLPKDLRLSVDVDPLSVL
jgi:primosomal protein N'